VPAAQANKLAKEKARCFQW